MLRTRLPAAIALLLLLPFFYNPAVGASASSVQYSVGVTGSAVSVSLNLNLFQNVTLLPFEKSFSLPILQVSAEGPNSTNLAQTLQGALQSKNSRAQVSNLIIQAATSPWSNKTSAQWLNISLGFTVTGVLNSQGETSKTDLSWKSFAISSDFALGNAEINRIGERDLYAMAGDMAAHSGMSSLIQIFYHISGKPIDPTQFQAAVSNMTILDFSAFATPISQWQRTQVSLAGETWSLTGGRHLGVDYTQEIVESGQTSTADYGLFYDLTGQVTAPYGAKTVGDTITFSTGGMTQAVMMGIVVSAVGLWAGAFVFESRVQSRTGRKKPKR